MAVAFAVAFGGALGALLRYGVDRWIERHAESAFPWATLAINASGCFAVGFLIAALVDRHRAPEWLRIGLVVGFCGGYTTFSTLGQETLDLVETRAVALAASYAVASVAFGVLAVWVGTRVGRIV